MEEEKNGIVMLSIQASVVGKRLGRHRWSPTTSKTVEGSAAFTLSVVVCAWILRACGLTEDFSVSDNLHSCFVVLLMDRARLQVARYTVMVGLSSVLEATSVQNDNLTLPVYMWSLLAIADV